MQIEISLLFPAPPVAALLSLFANLIMDLPFGFGSTGSTVLNHNSSRKSWDQRSRMPNWDAMYENALSFFTFDINLVLSYGTELT